MTANLLMGLTAWGVFTFVLGLVVVFVGMTIIIFFVSITGKAITAASIKKEKKATESVKEEETTQTEEDIPEEVRVAIIAAIYAYYGEKPSAKNEFIVKKIKKL